MACPPGSIYDKKQESCNWCLASEFFHENQENYFQSECAKCPAGTVGGYENECVPCEGGKFYDDSNKFAKCEKCPPNALCPIGTKFKFPLEKFAPFLDEVVVKNIPETYQINQEGVDKTATIVFVVWSFCAFMILILVVAMNNQCKEKSLFIFRELDLLPITGGTRKRWVGGIITMFYFMVIFIIINGFLLHWMFYNRRIEASEVTELMH